MKQLFKTILEAIDGLSNTYFTLWLMYQFAMAYTLEIRVLPFLYYSGEYLLDTMNIIAYVCLAIILLLPKSLYKYTTIIKGPSQGSTIYNKYNKEDNNNEKNK